MLFMVGIDIFILLWYNLSGGSKTQDDTVNIQICSFRQQAGYERSFTMTENITVNEQNSIRIDGDRVIYFDPYHIDGEPKDADLIFFTHDHYDHFSPNDIARVSKPDTFYAAPESMAQSMEKAGIPEDKITYLTPGDSIELLGIPVEGVAAYNTLKPFHPKRNGWLGYVVTVGGKRIYVCGDTDDIPEGRAVKCDIICVPIGGTFTMNPKKAAAFVNAISPAYAIPTHYGTAVGKPSDDKAFEKEISGSVRVVRKIQFT